MSLAEFAALAAITLLAVVGIVVIGRRVFSDEPRPPRTWTRDPRCTCLVVGDVDAEYVEPIVIPDVHCPVHEEGR